MKQLKLSYALVELIGDRLLVSCFILVVILSTIFLLPSNPVLAASRSSTIPATGCVPTLSNHCYAEASWSGGTPGAFTELSPWGYVNCQGCGTNDFLTQEMWYVDYNSSQCQNTPYHACWIEGGIITHDANSSRDCNPGYNSTCMFWGDNRPNGGGFYEHDFTIGGYGVSLDPYWIDVAFHSANGNYSTTDTWNVSVYLYDSSGAVITVNQQSTSNYMSPTTIIVGSEITSSYAYTSNHTDDTYNEWFCGSSWCYQTTTGNVSIGSPPYGYWSVNPCNCSGNTGGVFTTYDHS